MKQVILSSLLLILILGGIGQRVYGQINPEAMRNEAEQEMKFGRYGESIDLLNRYISARPQKADGYNLRGICYEKREQFELSVYDYRSARKLDPSNKEIRKNLERATSTWYKLLYNNIEGYKREIAINPNKAENYLEIGKAYKNLGKWEVAEQWYDQYLAREHASPDEIIRYTEILAKNNHIAKGWPILKKYTDEYPEDQRLWSRYGYFSMWLGKNKIAIKAFENALALKPYFKEAQDGLDQAKGKGYIYTVNDTASRYNYGMPVPAKYKQYAIDKYYSILKKRPDDNEIRFKLVKELVKAERYSEANDELQTLIQDTSKTEYQDYYTNFKSLRDSVFEKRITDYAAKFKADPHNKEVAIKLADAYGHTYDFDSSMEVLSEYLKGIPENKELDVRFLYAKYASWNYEWNEARVTLDNLLKYDPNNLDYQLLSAQITAWNVTESKQEEIDNASRYIKNVLAKDPNNMLALIAEVYLKSGQGDMVSAKKVVDQLKTLYPEKKEITAIQNYYNTRLLVAKEKEILNMRGKAGKLYLAGNCNDALKIYDDIFEREKNPSRDLILEYASVSSCAKAYTQAIDLYNQALNLSYDSETASLLALNYLWSGDTTKCLIMLQDLQEKNPSDFRTNYYLGDIYERTKQPEKAIAIYDRLLSDSLRSNLDSTQIATLETRLGYLNTGFGGGFGRFPAYVALSPMASYYADNQDFRLSDIGGRLEVGITSFLTIGASYSRTGLTNKYYTRYLSSNKWLAYLRLVKGLTASVGFGTIHTVGYSPKNIADASLKYQGVEDRLTTSLSYETTDGRLALYSPYILDKDYRVNIVRFNIDYLFRSGFKVLANYQHLSISDNNSGDNLQFRLGKSLYKDLFIGYEYLYSNFSFMSSYYYSPASFSAHSIWFDWRPLNEDNIKLDFGGKFGYVPQSDYLLREGFGQITYKPLPILNIVARISAASSYRYDGSYNYLSGLISAYISLF